MDISENDILGNYVFFFMQSGATAVEVIHSSSVLHLTVSLSALSESTGQVEIAAQTINCQPQSSKSIECWIINTWQIIKNAYWFFLGLKQIRD